MRETKKERKARQKNQRHDFLLTFFDEKEGYEEKEVNGFWLIKQWNGNTRRWEVAIYSQESYARKIKSGETVSDLRLAQEKLSIRS